MNIIDTKIDTPFKQILSSFVLALLLPPLSELAYRRYKRAHHVVDSVDGSAIVAVTMLVVQLMEVNSLTYRHLEPVMSQPCSHSTVH